MTAYATAERPGSALQLNAPSLDAPLLQMANLPSSNEPNLIDVLLGRLADLVVERLTERSQTESEPVEEWMDTRRAAVYLGVHRDTIRKLAAERSIATHQDGPGCKLSFRRDELDEWRRSSRPTSRTRSNGLRAVS